MAFALKEIQRTMEVQIPTFRGYDAIAVSPATFQVRITPLWPASVAMLNCSQPAKASTSTVDKVHSDT